MCLFLIIIKQLHFFRREFSSKKEDTLMAKCSQMIMHPLPDEVTPIFSGGGVGSFEWVELGFFFRGV